MKKVMTLTLCLLLALSAVTFAANSGNLTDSISADLEAKAEITPYARVWAQRVTLKEEKVQVGPFKFKWLFWDEGEPGMDFGSFGGEAHYGKAADSNCFILETNTDVTVTFSGEALKHKSSGNTMPTRYLAFLSASVTELGEPVLPLIFPPLNVPLQIVPVKKIGYFGEAGAAPSLEAGREVEQIIFMALEWLLGEQYWPEGDLSSVLYATSNDVTGKGYWAFQVFGFASTGEISSQPEGEYEGKIIITVSR